VDAKVAPSSETQSQPPNKEGTMALPEVGSEPPAFTLPNQDGKDISLSDYAGKNVLIWFFPRAFGGG
jgi:peroxiredoxin